MVPRSYIHQSLIIFVASLFFPTWNYCSPQNQQASPNTPSSRSTTGAAAGNAAGTTPGTSSGAASGNTGAGKGNSSHGIYLVFPFQNSGPSSRLDWLSEGLEELTIQGLSSAGEQVYSHSWRLGELERYGIPTTAKLSRATMLHVAEDLDADFVVFGSFNYDGKNLTVDGRLLRVNPAALLQPLHESGPLETVMDLHTRLMWRMLSENDHAYPLSLTEFSQMHKAVRLDAFEHYIRGLIANDDETRLRASLFYAKRLCVGVAVVRQGAEVARSLPGGAIFHGRVQVVDESTGPGGRSVCDAADFIAQQQHSGRRFSRGVE